MRVLAPAGYAERVGMVISAMPGTWQQRAGALEVERGWLRSVVRGSSAWPDFEALAARTGVDAKLLLHGPTLALRGALVTRRMLSLTAGLFGENEGHGKYRLNPRDVDAVEAYQMWAGSARGPGVEVGGWPVVHDVSVAEGTVEWEPVRLVDDIASRIRASLGDGEAGTVLVSPFDLVLVGDVLGAVAIAGHWGLPPGVFQVVPDRVGVRGCPAPGVEVDPVGEFIGVVQRAASAVELDWDEIREVSVSSHDFAAISAFTVERGVSLDEWCEAMDARVVEGDLPPGRVAVKSVVVRDIIEGDVGELPPQLVALAERLSREEGEEGEEKVN